MPLLAGFESHTSEPYRNPEADRSDLIGCGAASLGFHFWHTCRRLKCQNILPCQEALLVDVINMSVAIIKHSLCRLQIADFCSEDEANANFSSIRKNIPDGSYQPEASIYLSLAPFQYFIILKFSLPKLLKEMYFYST